MSRSSSQVQDTGFSSRQQGFESPTGRQFPSGVTNFPAVPFWHFHTVTQEEGIAPPPEESQEEIAPVVNSTPVVQANLISQPTRPDRPQIDRLDQRETANAVLPIPASPASD